MIHNHAPYRGPRSDGLCNELLLSDGRVIGWCIVSHDDELRRLWIEQLKITNSPVLARLNLED